MQQPSIILNDWFEQFSQRIASCDVQGLTSLFLPNGWLRDHLIFEWNYRTLHGQSDIEDYLAKNLEKTQITNLCLEGSEGIPPGFNLGGHAVEAAFTFETLTLWGRGYVLLQESDTKAWKALSIYFSAVDLKGHEENKQIPSGYYDEHRKTWTEAFEEENTRIENDPHVIILGAGQNGLNIGARFRQMHIPTLILEQSDRVGDIWRKRYSNLTLHTPNPHHTLLYTKFPENWPKWTPKEKVANMLEQYAVNQDLVIWHRSTILPTPFYDSTTRRWTVEISKDGEKVTLRPYHIVLSIGLFSKPFVPPLSDAELFNGPKFHATHYKGYQPFINKNVIVIGASQTASDICQNLALHDAASVIMVQRSSTIVISNRYLHETVLDIGYPINANLRNIDFRASGVPFGLLKQLQIAGKDKRIADQKHMLDGLVKAGLNLNEGEDGAGQFFRVFERLGGYWQDLGTADLINKGDIKIKRGEPERFTADGLVFKDGSFLSADAVIFATGYEPAKNAIASIFGEDVANEITPVWGINEVYELRRIFTPSGRPGIWWGTGDLGAGRYHSKALGIQIKARLLGIITDDDESMSAVRDRDSDGMRDELPSLLSMSSDSEQPYLASIPKISAPSSEVFKRFNIDPSVSLERLSGGRGLVYRAGNVVLKRLDTTVETLEWLANTFSHIKETEAYTTPTLRLSTPIFSQLEDGSKVLIVEGWTAWNWLDGVGSESLGPLLEDPIRIKKGSQVVDEEYDPSLLYKWDHIIKAGEAFSALMRKYMVTKPTFLEARKDPWGLADRIAWNELLLEDEMMIEVYIDNKTYPMSMGCHWKTDARYLGEALDILQSLHQMESTDKDESEQIIHGDLTGNVLFSLPLTSCTLPGIIDISPYFRPPSFSTAIVVVDALACENAPVRWAMTYLKNSQQVDVFARALIFRIVSDYLLGVAGVGAGDDYTRPMEALRRVVKELIPEGTRAYIKLRIGDETPLPTNRLSSSLMWPFKKSYRTVQVRDLRTSYDYIIIGGGPAGCVITNRLSEDPNVSILLIEKGDLAFSWASHVPLLSSNFQSDGVRSKKYASVPQKNLGDKVSEIVIGHALGGSSRINGMVYTRGLPAQFTNWTEQGLKGWSYDELHSYFLKSEGAIGRTNIHHNTAGEWKNRSISSPKCYFPTADAAIKAAEDLRFPLITDFNSSDQPIFGMAKLHHNIDENGYRCDAASAFLPPNLVESREGNIDICVNAIVTHLSICPSDSGFTVDKVHVERTINDGTSSTISANKEVVLCAGSIGTAQLLLLSGIGPREHLSDLGIEVHKDWPVVGNTLQDHLGVPTLFTIPLEDSLLSLEKRPTVAIRELLKYQFSGSGMFLCPVHELALFTRSDLLSSDSHHLGDDKINSDRYSGKNLPDIEIITIAHAALRKDKKRNADGGYSIWAIPVHPRSRGSVRLRSKDPRDTPAVDPNFLADPHDREVLHAAIKLSLRLKEQMASNGYPIIDHAVPEGTTDEELDKFIVEWAQSVYHYTSSCRMASDSSSGVVDEELRVHGFSGLRIADASIFPDIVVGHMQATVIAVAEKCADLLKQSSTRSS